MRPLSILYEWRVHCQMAKSTVIDSLETGGLCD